MNLFVYMNHLALQNIKYQTYKFFYNNTDKSMGVTTHKPFKNIIDSKYSFTHPKSYLPLQISAWKFVEQELQLAKECLGEPMRWPFKFYSDQGYIIITITNHNAKSNKWSATTEIDKRIAEVKTTISMLQILYSFFHSEIQEYLVEQIVIQNESKYVNEVLSMKVYIYVGENLSSEAKIKLLSYGIQLGRYVSRGGICSVSKLYHEYEQIIEVQNQVKLNSALQKNQEYYVSLNTLVQENLDKDKKWEQIVFSKLSNYSFLNKIFFQDYLRVKQDKISVLKDKKGKRKQPLYSTCQIFTNKKLVIKELQKVKQVKTKVQVPKKVQINESLPFQCEITQINIKQKRANVDQSNLMDELSVLNEKPNCQFVKVICEEQDYLVITDYTSLRESKKCTQYNIQLIINLAPHSCYNYYLNEINYLYYYLSPIPNKFPADAVLFQNNIEHIIIQITQNIMQLTANNKPNNSLNNRVIIHSLGSLFSDENCAVIIGYLMARYLYTYQKAFSVLNKHFKIYKQNESSQLFVNKIYVDQLLTLQGRILMTSVPNYGVSINVNNWRVYQVSNNHCCPSQSLIARFIGQIGNPNQLTSLSNSNHHCFIVISHQIVTILTQTIEKWQKESSMKNLQGIKGISVYFGKQFDAQLKDSFLNKCKKQISLILKYQFFNRNKRIQTFNNELCFKFIENIVSQNIQTQIIQKSFRKAQPFTPLYVGFEQDNPAKEIQKVVLPHNPKQKLTFKYPYLRPMWQSLKDDEYYFIVQITKGTALIKMIKGKNWAGYQVDKELYFQNIVKLYLKNISQQKIWVNQQGDQSLFNDPLDS